MGNPFLNKDYEGRKTSMSLISVLSDKQAGTLNLSKSPNYMTEYAVLTQKNVEGKLEEVDPRQEGKRPCRRHNEPLRKNLRWKQCFRWPLLYFYAILP